MTNDISANTEINNRMKLDLNIFTLEISARDKINLRFYLKTKIQWEIKCNFDFMYGKCGDIVQKIATKNNLFRG